MTTTVREETLADIWDDMQPLLAQHWREIASYQDIPLSPDRAFYETAERNQSLLIVTARRERELIGYAVFFVTPNRHYSTSVQAVQDVFYVESTSRGALIGRRLIRASEQLLRERGCQVVHQHVKLAHPVLGALLAREGYEPMETIYSKRLDQEK